jgi:hypothetical protein
MQPKKATVTWRNACVEQLSEHAPAMLEAMLRWYRPWALAWYKRRLPVTRLYGPTPSGQPGTVVVAGTAPWAYRLPYRFFTTKPQHERLGEYLVWRLPTILQQLGETADLTLAYVDRLAARLFFRHGYLTIPATVDCWSPVADALSTMAQPNRSLKEDLRVVRRERLQPEVSHTTADCDMFCQTMHAPFVRMRHGEIAIVHSLMSLRRMVRCGGIVWAQRCGERIAGCVVRQQGDTLRMVALGTANGEQKWVHYGAITALYRFCIQYAYEQGCTQINFGAAMPILNDGLLRYKCKWGAQVALVPHDTYHHMLWWTQPSRPLLDFFAHTPAIFQSHGRLAGLTARSPGEAGTAAELLELQRSLAIPGLQQLVVMSASSQDLASASSLLQAPHASPTETAMPVVLRSAAQFLHEFAGT